MTICSVIVWKVSLLVQEVFHTELNVLQQRVLSWEPPRISR